MRITPRFAASLSRRGGFLQWPLEREVVFSQNLHDIESHWAPKLRGCELSTKDENVEPKYVLGMFPYPSGNLHIGHLRVYCISDTIARYYALNGYRVIHPMGWDAFGLPAENAAIERNIDPKTWTHNNIAIMREQLLKTGLNFDWDRELTTCQPDYYRWTQWLFLQLYKHGLVRRKFDEVNWDPVDATTLAAEQVDALGRSWRSGAPVEKRKLYQWAVETPAYAKVMLEALESVRVGWRDVASIQAEWIGKCDVHRFLLPVLPEKQSTEYQNEETLDLRLIDPQQMLTADFLVIRDRHPLGRSSLGEKAEGIERDGILLLKQKAYNFLNDSYLPIVLTRTSGAEEDWFLDARIADPKSNPHDAHVAKLFDLPLCGVWKRPEVKMNNQEICKIAQAQGRGGYITSRKLVDWVVSRQRAWGTPIPMLLNEEKHGSAPVDEAALPVLSELRGQRMQTHKLPSGYGYVETDTLDTFFDSSWYFLRYLDPHNSAQLFNPKIANRDMPVSVYVGGIEHAAVHLFFARFVNRFLHDISILDRPEPFTELITLGMVRGKTYFLTDSKAFVRAEEVENIEGKLEQKSTGKSVTVGYDKMSKSKYNGIDPMQVISVQGKDMTKLQLLTSAGPRDYLDWGENQESIVKGLRSLVDRVARIVNVYVEARALAAKSGSQAIQEVSPDVERVLSESRNTFIRDASMALEVWHMHNTGIEKLQMLANTLKVRLGVLGFHFRYKSGEVASSKEFEKSIHALVIMLQVFAPHLAAELWSALSTVSNKLQPELWNNEEPVWRQEWPRLDTHAKIDFVMGLFGTTSRVRVPRSALEHLNEDAILQLAKNSYHSLLFTLLDENGIGVADAKVQQRPGLYVTVHLKLTKRVPSETIDEILHKVAEEKAGKKLKKRTF